MFVKKQYIEQLIKKEQLVKYQPYLKRVELPTYNKYGGNKKLDLVYSKKYDKYAVIDTVKPYKVLFHLTKMK